MKTLYGSSLTTALVPDRSVPSQATELNSAAPWLMCRLVERICGRSSVRRIAYVDNPLPSSALAMNEPSKSPRYFLDQNSNTEYLPAASPRSENLTSLWFIGSECQFMWVSTVHDS